MRFAWINLFIWTKTLGVLADWRYTLKDYLTYNVRDSTRESLHLQAGDLELAEHDYNYDSIFGLINAVDFDQSEKEIILQNAKNLGLAPGMPWFTVKNQVKTAYAADMWICNFVDWLTWEMEEAERDWIKRKMKGFRAGWMSANYLFELISVFDIKKETKQTLFAKATEIGIEANMSADTVMAHVRAALNGFEPPTMAPTKAPTMAPTKAPTDAPTNPPATDAPATDAPATDAPATDAPATDAPATDAPATDAPATDAPATDAPATDAPATDAPATDAPSTVDSPLNADGMLKFYSADDEASHCVYFAEKEKNGEAKLQDCGLDNGEYKFHWVADADQDKYNFLNGIVDGASVGTLQLKGKKKNFCLALNKKKTKKQAVVLHVCDEKASKAKKQRFVYAQGRLYFAEKQQICLMAKDGVLYGDKCSDNAFVYSSETQVMSFYSTSQEKYMCLYANADAEDENIHSAPCSDVDFSSVVGAFKVKEPKNLKKLQETFLNQEGGLVQIETAGGMCMALTKYKKLKKPVAAKLMPCSKKKWKSQRFLMQHGKVHLEFSQKLCMEVPFKKDDSKLYFGKCSNNAL
jgi:hypothetical protein